MPTAAAQTPAWPRGTEPRRAQRVAGAYSTCTYNPVMYVCDL